MFLLRAAARRGRWGSFPWKFRGGRQGSQMQAAIFGNKGFEVMSALFPPETFPQVRHPDPPLQPLLLWDGGCGFCALSIRCFERLARRPVATAPVQPLLHLLPSPARETALRQVLLIEPGGEISGGVRAIAYALRAAGRPGLGAVLLFPLIYPFARLAYRLIARLRGHFPAPGGCAR
jgi:predicted DCC family thiol-disulfide oxidoreductase YuxK